MKHEIAYGRHPLTNEVIAVKSGETGYWQTPGVDPEQRNKELGVSEEMATTMIKAALQFKHYA